MGVRTKTPDEPLQSRPLWLVWTAWLLSVVGAFVLGLANQASKDAYLLVKDQLVNNQPHITTEAKPAAHTTPSRPLVCCPKTRKISRSTYSASFTVSNDQHGVGKNVKFTVQTSEGCVLGDRHFHVQPATEEGLMEIRPTRINATQDLWDIKMFPKNVMFYATYSESCKEDVEGKKTLIVTLADSAISKLHNRAASLQLATLLITDIDGSSPQSRDGDETARRVIRSSAPIEMHPAQNSAAFGDEPGVVASTLQDGDTSPPASQCSSTPFQCIPVRVGLSATNWASMADRIFNARVLASDSPLTVSLGRNGTGACTTISDCAYQELNDRVSYNANNVFVYLDQDSGFNHALPCGYFGDVIKVSIDDGCVDDSSDTTTGCYPATNTTVLDVTRGTVLRATCAPLPTGDFAGLNIEEPEGWSVLRTGNGYDLTGATQVVFDARSPGANSIQFGVGECVPSYLPVSQTWQSMTIQFSSVSCQPDLSSVHVLFEVAANDSNGDTVLLDHTHFINVLARASQGSETLSLPLSTQTFGAVPHQAAPFPPEQVNRNVASLYESALTLTALLNRAQPGDLTNTEEIANALDYALNYDNHGDPLPAAPDGSLGMHSAYESGDICLLNDQLAPAVGKAGDIRLAGFSAATTSCGGAAFCLVLDGATGGNNAFAILALLGAHRQFNNAVYFDDAKTIGNWIVGDLKDTTGTSFGGFYLGYPDGGLPKPLILSKSTENNADIFAALSLLAHIDTASGSYWTTNANSTYTSVNLVPTPTYGANGIAWEFTGQDVDTCSYLDILLGITTFQDCASMYASQIQQAQMMAPFGDGLGVVASECLACGTYVFDHGIAGFFVWSDDAAFYNRETDVEFSGGYTGANNAQYIVQPYNNPGSVYQFVVSSGPTESTPTFDWTAGGGAFSSWEGSATNPGTRLGNVTVSDSKATPARKLYTYNGARLSGGSMVIASNGPSMGHVLIIPHTDRPPLRLTILSSGGAHLQVFGDVVKQEGESRMDIQRGELDDPETALHVNVLESGGADLTVRTGVRKGNGTIGTRQHNTRQGE